MARKFNIKTKAEAVKWYKTWQAANTSYHNGDAIMLDADFDALTDALEPFYPQVRSVIGAKITNSSARKVTLPNAMGSLDKVNVSRPESLRLLANITKGRSRIVVEEKVDGGSLQYVSDAKGGRKLFTRGDGRVGQDVSHLIPMLQLGEIEPNMAIRVEIVLPYKTHKKLISAGDGKAPRNLVSGLINSSKNINAKVAKSAICVAFSIYKPEMSPLQQLATLKRLGWHVPRHKAIDAAKATPAMLTKLLKEWRTTARYEMDGLVVLQNKYEKATPGTNPKYSIAFKVDEPPTEAKVLRVEWVPSQYGALKPVVHIEPKQIGGVTVSKATGHDARNILSKKIGPGAVVQVIRSGDVIPKIVGVKTPAAKASMPPKGTYEWDGANIVSNSDEHDEDITKAQVLAFFSAIGVLGFGDAVAALVAHMPIPQIAGLSTAQWRKLGAGQADSAKLPVAIKAALEGTTVPRLMAASSVFGRGFGLTKANAMWSELRGKVPNTKSKLAETIANIPGFSQKSAAGIAANWRTWVEFYNDLPYKPKATKTKASLAGKVYVFSEYRDRDLENFITSNGGTVSNSVSSKTTALFTYPSAKTTKANAARKLDVPIVDPSKARSLVGYK